MRRQASRSPLWVLLETATSAVFSLGSMLAIGRVIGPEATGTGTVAVAAFLLLDIAGSWLFTDALSRVVRFERRHAATALSSATLVGLAAGLVLLLGAPHLAWATGAPGAEMLCLALAPLLPLSAFAGAASGVAQREQRFALLAMRAIVGLPIALAVGLLLAAFGAGPWAIVGCQGVATLTSFLLMLAFGRLPLRPTINATALREMLSIALPQTLSMVVVLGKYRLFLLLLGLLTTEAVVAICHFAFRMFDSVLVLVGQTTSRISMRRVYALHDDRNRLAEIYGEFAQFLALLGLPASIGIALTAPDLVDVLLGPDWAPAAEVARIVGLAAAVTFLQGDYATLFVAVGKAHRNLAWSLLFLAVMLAALATFRPTTPAGIALCWAVQSLAAPVLLLPAVLREIDRSPLWLLRRLAPALFATTGMAAAVLAVRSGADLGPAERLLASVTVGATTYLFLAWAALGGQRPMALRSALSQPAE